MNKVRLLAYASASILALNTPAFAQTTANEQADSASSMDDIIVLARRREERLQDVPKAVNVVTSDTIHKLNIQRLDDIQSVVPGLNLQNSNNGVSQAATIRGVAFDVTSGASPTVEFYLNDASIQQNVIFQSLYDIGQIEVLRGPQGTLRGRASPSGSITFTTKRPDLDEFGGYADGTASTGIDGLTANGGLNVPIIKGKLALRVAGLVDDNVGDNVRSAYPAIYPAKPFARTWSERVSLRFTPTDNLEFNGTYQHLVKHQLNYLQTQSICLFDATIACNNPANAGTAYPGVISARDRLSTINGFQTLNQKQDLWTWGADWHIAGQKLSYVGDFVNSRISRTSSADFAGVFTALSQAAGFKDDQLLESRGKYQTHEVRISSEEKIAGFLDYTVGFFTLDMPTNNNVISPLVVPGSAFNSCVFAVGGTCFQTLGQVLTSATGVTFTPIAGGAVYKGLAPFSTFGDRKESSIFGNVTVHIGDNTEISGGIRKFLSASNSSVNVISSSYSKEKPTIWTASLSHHFTDDIMAYAQAGSSFRQGPDSIGPIASAGGVALTSDVLKFVNLASEKSKSYEIGLKSQWLDHKVTLNLAYYHQDFTNYLYTSPYNVFYLDSGATLANASSRLHNAPGFGANVPVRVDGFEADLGFRPSRDFSLGASFSYAHSKIKNGVIPCNGQLGNQTAIATALITAFATQGAHVLTCTANGPASFSPRFSMTAQGEYSHPINDQMTGYLRGLLNYYGKTPHNPDAPYNDQTAYALLNVYAGLRAENGKWDISLFAKNVTNTQHVLANYIGNTQQVTSLVVTALGSNYAGVNITPPRQFGINLRVAFGSR